MDERTRHPLESGEVAAARLAAIVDSSDDAIVAKTLEGIITSWNRSAERMFGYTADEAIGQHISLIIPKDRRGEEGQVISRIKNGEKVDHFETVRQAKDGSLLEISLSVSPVYDSTGQIVGVSKVARDITDRRRIERERAQLLEQVQADNKAKDEFLALLGHELRNPLAAIARAGQLLAIARNLEDIARPQIVIARQVAHLARLVDDLLDVARVRAGKITLERKPVLLSDAVEHALDVLRSGMRPAWHVIEVDCGDVTVDADPVRLEQIILNLLTNAVKYTPAGRRIRVSARAANGQGELRVQDEGVGIAPSSLPRIFGLFVQGEWTVDRAEGGLGIGLTLVRTLTELHGGTVEAFSEGPGRGSLFTVRLPLATQAEQAKPAPAEPGSSRRILIVEDNADAREMLRVLLERQGHEVFEAADGAEGLRMALELRPNLSLIDIGLPIVDGYEVARLIRESNESGRLVALTGYGQPEDRQRSLAAGFDDHLVKPVAPARLLAVVSKAGDNKNRAAGS